jgi:glucose/arabinose dehydrogenase
LYFVTELRGKIKVVTNDRTVYTFAEGFLQSEFGNEQVPVGESEYGLGGLCLAPEQGYLFVTFAYQDETGTLRNNVMRFETTPETFGLKPTSQVAFTKIFAPYETGNSHQIGSCQISNDMLYVSVGDGLFWPHDSQQKDSLRGKLIRMTLDGKPVADNPFYVDGDTAKAINYIFALGLRNAFSLEVVNGTAFLAENGWSHDRFYEVKPGGNYIWNGYDESIAANADYVFLETVAAVHMDYYKDLSPAFPDKFKDQFYISSSSIKETAGIVRIPYGVKEGMMTGVPEHFVKPVERPTDWAIGNEWSWVAGLAFGPDGLYFAPLMPVRNEKSAVMKVTYDPANAHPLTLKKLEARELAAADSTYIEGFMHRKGCLGCHAMGKGTQDAVKAPSLGGNAMVERVQQQISSPEYLKGLQELNARDDAEYNRYDEWRDKLAQAQGTERVRTYLTYQILEPGFDGPSGMPDLGLSRAEAEAITDYLLSGEGEPAFLQEIWGPWWQKATKTEPRRLTTAFGGGMLAGGLLIGLFMSVVLAWFARRRRGRS